MIDGLLNIEVLKSVEDHQIIQFFRKFRFNAFKLLCLQLEHSNLLLCQPFVKSDKRSPFKKPGVLISKPWIIKLKCPSSMIKFSSFDSWILVLSLENYIVSRSVRWIFSPKGLECIPPLFITWSISHCSKILNLDEFRKSSTLKFLIRFW